ncbi:MAG: ABC transporter permease, partial [Pseudomonadota bacterium]
MTRGITVAVVAGVGIHLSGLASLNVTHVWPILWFGLTSAIVLSALGAIGGIWADKFDHLAAISNFVIVPLTFLSGTFYDIKVMVEPFYTLALFDPLFYFIDGFRYGFLGVANSDITIGVIVSGVMSVLGIAAVWWVFKTGYKLKA